MKSFIVFAWITVLAAGCASAQMTIANVANAGSRLPRNSPFAGVAQGALFVVTGRNLGPEGLQQATFPLPAADGLAGVSIRVAVGGTVVDAIMVYTMLNEVAAILPSQTPLGAGTVTVNNNGATASAPITVVAAAFGIFPTAPGTGRALAFNVSADDGSLTQNDLSNSVRPGQDILINGTGLGAIPSDETQPGVTDVPDATVPVHVWVGMVPAAVVSAGRGDCCDGLDPAFRVPRGIAAWDVIRFTIPDGVVGCAVPILVQIGKLVSNGAFISVDSGGGVCVPPASLLPPEVLQNLSDKPGSTGVQVGLQRAITINGTRPAGLVITRRDTGSAAFTKVTNYSAAQLGAGYVARTPNTCFVPPPVVIPAAIPIEVNLDAGAAITVSGANGNRSIPRQTVGMIVRYPSGILGNATPGNYLDPGHYTMSGPGGKDVAAFSASIDVPTTPFVWTNVPDTARLAVERATDLPSSGPEACQAPWWCSARQALLESAPMPLRALSSVGLRWRRDR